MGEDKARESAHKETDIIDVDTRGVATRTSSAATTVLLLTIAVGAGFAYLVTMAGDITTTVLGSHVFNLSTWCGLIGPGIGLWLSHRARSTPGVSS